MKAIVYLKGGLGDVYPVLSILPKVMEDRGLKKEDMKFFTDCVYLLFPEIYGQRLKNVMVELLKVGGVEEYEIIPEKYQSANDLDWPNKEAQICGPNLGKNCSKNDFFLWRFPWTKKYMKEEFDKLPKDSIIIDDIVAERIFEWKDGEYKDLRNYERVPLNFVPSEKEKIYIDKICTGKHLLIHIRVKGKGESISDFNKIIKHCKDKGIKCILLGMTDEGSIESSENIIDLRINKEEGKISFTAEMYLSYKAKLMLASSSGFTIHRFYYNFIAQEFQQVFPESVKGSGEYLKNDSVEILQIDPYNAYVVTIKAVQDLINENSDLKSKLKNIQEENKQIIKANAEMLNRLEKVETLLSSTAKK